ARWNLDHPDLTTSYPRVLAARETMRYQGAEGLLAKYGQRRGESSVPDKWFAVFKSLYLKEGSPPAEHCWRVVFGLASKAGEAQQLPRYRAFLRRLDRE